MIPVSRSAHHANTTDRLAAMLRQLPASSVTTRDDGSVFVIVSNDYTRLRWLNRLDAHPDIRAVVDVVEMASAS